MHISPIGLVHSTLKQRSGAPRQGWEGAPNAKLEIHSDFVQGLDGVQPGQDIWILTWLHESDRSVLKVRPRGDLRNPITGVFATRSPDRPNPIGLHRAKVMSVDGDGWLQVEGLEAIDGTPIVDIKPVLDRNGGSWMALLLGVNAFETALLASGAVPSRLKALAQIKTSALIGCPFWLDIGSAVGREMLDLSR
jgi:tRNA-Thr(GGU) m(6)t(6)A37 methyltransferase TsaA